ncbi:MAG: FlgD immunoglobulin-like domain containing protein [Gemmatimonadota bacterium]
MRGTVAGALLLLATSPALAQGRIPPECWLDQRDNAINSCKYCHTAGQPGASNDDIDRQGTFSAQVNEFLNALEPERLDALVPPESIPADLSGYLDLDNYHLALQERGGTVEAGTGQGEYKFFPDLDPEQTGADGFANNGWRAFKWKPFELAWPRYNGRIQRNWIRLPEKFQRNAAGALDRGVYRQNLDRLVAVVRGEVASGTYLGQAADETVVPYRFPAGTEVLHYLYYLDPSRPGMKAVRIKEVRWNIKTVPEAENQEYFGYVSAQEKRRSLTWREGGPDQAAPFGLTYNEDGWDLIGFIEDRDGRLRPQTQQEMTQCLGCHGRRVGVPIDSHWQSLQRKLPGEAGWALQDYAGIYDYYNARLGRGEMGEIFENYEGSALELPGNPDGTIRFLPTPAEADALTRRYYQIVQTQSFALGRDPKPSNPGFLRNPSTSRFLPKEEQEAWQPLLDFSRYDLAPVPTAVADSPDPRPRQVVLLPAYPNPFNADAVLRFELARSTAVSLEVYDGGGQRVRTLARGRLGPGFHTASWDGRDEGGTPMASGTYLCRLTAGAEVAAVKLVLLK